MFSCQPWQDHMHRGCVAEISLPHLQKICENLLQFKTLSPSSCKALNCVQGLRRLHTPAYCFSSRLSSELRNYIQICGEITARQGECHIAVIGGVYWNDRTRHAVMHALRDSEQLKLRESCIRRSNYQRRTRSLQHTSSYERAKPVLISKESAVCSTRTGKNGSVSINHITNRIDDRNRSNNDVAN